MVIVTLKLRTQRRCLRLRIQRWIAPVILAALLGHGAVAGEDIRYDPASCKADAKGKMYVALGPTVLAVPLLTSGVVISDILPTNHVRLKSPDPDQPSGCPDNPMQLQAYAFNYQYERGQRVRAGIPIAPNPQPQFLEIGAFAPGKKATDETYASMLTQKICSIASVRETLANGLEACRVKPVQSFRIEDWGSSYVAQPNGYATPFGTPFSVNCDPLLFSNQIGHCEVAYALTSVLTIRYWFQPYLGPNAISIDHIIDFDRDLRAQISAMVVTDFSWAN